VTAVEQRRARVRELHAAGYNSRQMARELHTSESTIGNDLKVLNLPTKKQQRDQKAAARRGRVRELAAEGYRQFQIARILNTTTSIIQDDFKAMGLPQPQNRVGRQRRDREFVRMAEAGMSRAAIEKELDISPHVLHQMEVRTGVRVRASAVLGKQHRFRADQFLERFTESLTNKVSTLEAIVDAVDEIDPALANTAEAEIERAINLLVSFRRQLIKRGLATKES
jgi:DNA-binding CsgD family transcriptional regulator